MLFIDWYKRQCTESFSWRKATWSKVCSFILIWKNRSTTGPLRSILTLYWLLTCFCMLKFWKHVQSDRGVFRNQSNIYDGALLRIWFNAAMGIRKKIQPQFYFDFCCRKRQIRRHYDGKNLLFLVVYQRCNDAS